jgi:L-ascorbate metabolism protein UlaG (beta-lactamase superfamily)
MLWIIINKKEARCMNNPGHEDALLKGISLMKNATIRIQRDKVFYFDPYRIERDLRDADFIFVSHDHRDHLSPEDIRKLIKEDTILVAPESSAALLANEGFGNVTAVLPLKSYEIGGVSFATVPMYNIGKKFHEKGKNWVGYVVRIDSADYYFAGDTDAIPEMENIKADVAFLPVGGTYTMNASEAARAANTIKPAVAVPMHYGDVAGTAADGEVFIRGLDRSIKGVLLK